MRKVNVRLVVILAVIMFFLGVGLIGLYFFQNHRHAKFFLSMAEARLQEWEVQVAARSKSVEAPRPNPELISQAIDFYNRYLRLNPSDTDVLAKLGTLYLDHGAFDTAFFTFERVLRLDPGHSDVRRQTIRAAMGMRPPRTRDARDHLESLLEETPDDAMLLDSLGQCAQADQDFDSAIASYEKAIESGSKEFETYRRLAQLCVQELRDREQGDAYMQQLVDRNSDDATAFAVRANYYLFCADRPETKSNERTELAEKALADARKALELAPGDLEALIVAADAANRTGDNELGMQYGKQLVELFPARSNGYLSIAETEDRRGNRDEAVAWLRKGLVPTEESLSLLWALAQYLTEDKKFEEARETLDRIRLRSFEMENLAMRAYTESRLKHSEAFMEVMKGNWRIAKDMFEANRASIADNPSLLRQADYWIAKCYENLGRAERAPEILGQSEELRDTPQGKLMIAQSMARVGRIDEALRICQDVLRSENPPKGALLEFARLLILRNRSLSKDTQDWNEVFRVLDQAEEVDPDRYQIALLRAQTYQSMGEIDEARTIFENAIAVAPKETALRSQQIMLEIGEKNWEKVEELLDAFHAEVGDSATARLVKANYFLARYEKDAVERLKELETGIAELDPDDQSRLREGLAAISRRTGDVEYSRTLTERMVQENPHDLSTQIALFELESRGKDHAAMKTRLERVREIEGEGPFWHYLSALYLVTGYHEAQTSAGVSENKPDPAVLDDALRHLSEAALARPKWAPPLVLTATIYDEKGNRERAIDYFGRALTLGERRPDIIRRQVVLLFQEQRFDEADRVINMLGEDEIKESEELTRIWAEVKLLRQEFEKALELAEVSAKNSDDYRDHVWLGRIYAAMARRAEQARDKDKAEKLTAESEQSLMKALSMNQTDPQPWIALIQLLVLKKDSAKARAVIEEAKAKVDPGRLSTALVEMYEIAGDFTSANRQLIEKLQENPEDTAMARRAAEFYLRQNRPGEAKVMLERLIEGKETPPSDLAWARRRLAMLLFEIGGYQNYLKSVALIDANLKLDPNSLFDRRIKARAMATRATRKQRKEAIAMIEDLLKGDQSGTAEDRFVLARLYLAEENWSKANEQMRQLLAVAGDNPTYLEVFIRDLLRRDEGREAGMWVDQLERLAPKSYATADLKAQVLAEEGKTDAAVAILNRFLEQDDPGGPDGTQRLLMVARTLEAIGRRLSELGHAAASRGATAEADVMNREAETVNREAEGMYRRYVQARPDEELVLGSFLAKKGDIDKAIEVLENSWSNTKVPSPSLGAAAVEMIVGIDATDSQLGRIEEVLNKALRARDNAESLLLAKAELYISQGRDRDAEDIYRKVLEKNPNNVVALNNLAVFLGHRGKDLDQALEMVNKSIELAGPVGSLLDSRATVYLGMEEWEAAIDDLQEAISDSPTAPRYFHLAEAHYGFQDIIEARKAMTKAESMGLSRKDLRKVEIPRYEALRKSLRESDSN